jgi:hypothetical protein
VDGLAGGGDPAAGEVDGHIVEAQDRLGPFEPGAALRGADASEQLPEAERLRDVVVCARVEGPDLVVLMVADRQHDHGDLRPGAEPADHLGAVDVRQAEVEDEQVGLLGGGDRQRLLAGLGADDVVAVRRERRAE